MFIKNTKLISKYENYYTQTNLILPFKGRWHVLFGGRNASFNYHRAIKPQMFAIDFDIQIDCKNYSHNGSLNQHYYCFDKPIICPGDGQVIFVENSILDNTPKFTNTDFPYGNLIIIDHNNGEYSFISQLKYQSIQVRQGMDVKQGEILARCGNSGFSFHPHLHYHLQNTSDVFHGEGLPISFVSYYSNKQYKKSGELNYGEYVINNNALLKLKRMIKHFYKPFHYFIHLLRI